MNPAQTTLTQLRDAIAQKQVSAAEAMGAYLDRIDRYGGALNAFREVFAERGMQRARDVDAGKVTGPLAGVPIAVKDNMCTSYGHTTCSSRMLENYQSPFTATAVAKLESAGAIIIGKTNLDEFAMGSSTEHSAFGPTCNPWDRSCVTGGSSGGSAAAVAADLAAGAIGSDTGGSIRQPAALCGVVGMKPTYGRVSRFGLVAFASSLDQIGPLGHTVADAALLLAVTAGRDDRDSTSADRPVDDFVGRLDEPVKPLRIGLGKQFMSDNNHPAVAAAVAEAVEVFTQCGADVVEVDLPHTEYGIPTYYIVATAEASSNLARYDGVRYGHRSSSGDELIELYSRSRAEGFGDEVKRRIMLGTYALSSGYYDAYYLRALKVRRLIKGDFDRVFGGENGGAQAANDAESVCDAILCPTTTGPAFKVGEKMADPLAMYLNDVYTVTANMAGIPGISLPAGKAATDSGPLPVAVQLLGQAFDEAKLLRIARMYERVAGHDSDRPSMA